MTLKHVLWFCKRSVFPGNGLKWMVSVKDSNLNTMWNLALCTPHTGVTKLLWEVPACRERHRTTVHDSALCPWLLVPHLLIPSDLLLHFTTPLTSVTTPCTLSKPRIPVAHRLMSSQFACSTSQAPPLLGPPQGLRSTEHSSFSLSTDSFRPSFCTATNVNVMFHRFDHFLANILNSTAFHHPLALTYQNRNL